MGNEKRLKAITKEYMKKTKGKLREETTVDQFRLRREANIEIVKQRGRTT